MVLTLYGHGGHIGHVTKLYKLIFIILILKRDQMTFGSVVSEKNKFKFSYNMKAVTLEWSIAEKKIPPIVGFEPGLA